MLQLHLRQNKKTMKKILSIVSLFAMLTVIGCGSEQKKTTDSEQSTTPKTTDNYDPTRGEGKYNTENLKLSDKLDITMADEGEKISNVKCASCHKYSDEKLVGPGWKDVTKRRTGVWIMNFITNPDPMLDKDPEAQAMLEICLVRMPNQNLSDEEARKILEFMRKNDGLK